MRYLAILWLFFGLATSTRAQQPNMADLQVKDSSGAVYTMEAWQKLVFSGKYGLQLQPDKKTALLVRLPEGQLPQFSNTSRPRESPFFKTGERIPSFNEKDMAGERFNLKEMTGKVVVLNFWFINCPPCRQEIPALNELVESYKNNPKVVFLAVALDEKNELEDFLKASPFNYHIISNGRFTTSKYGIMAYPTHVVLDKQGKLLFHTSGLEGGTLHWLKRSIEAGLNDTVPQ